MHSENKHNLRVGAQFIRKVQNTQAHTCRSPSFVVFQNKTAISSLVMFRQNKMQIGLER